MVSTRSHPSAFPPPELASPTKSPSKRGGSRASSTASPAPSAKPVATSNASITSAPALTSNSIIAKTTTSAAPAGAWAHTPSNLTLIWLAVSLPLVIWDTGYMLLRPHTMPGGALHWPVWQPYALYGTVDHVYGFPAWEAQDGFGAAQASLNAVETALYLAYLGIVLRQGRDSGAATTGRGAPPAAKGLWLAHARTVAGRPAAQAVLIGLSAAVMTLSKTVLYWLCEWFNGFHNIGHNDFWTLLTLWIIPNGLWLVFSAIMTYQFSAEIVQGLDVAASAGSSKKLE